MTAKKKPARKETPRQLLERRLRQSGEIAGERWRHTLREIARLEQRLADAESLIVTLTDRFNQRDPSPAGMTKHLHPSNRKCMACAPEPMRSESTYRVQHTLDCQAAAYNGAGWVCRCT